MSVSIPSPDGLGFLKIQNIHRIRKIFCLVCFWDGNFQQFLSNLSEIRTLAGDNRAGSFKSAYEISMRTAHTLLHEDRVQKIHIKIAYGRECSLAHRRKMHMQPSGTKIRKSNDNIRAIEFQPNLGSKAVGWRLSIFHCNKNRYARYIKRALAGTLTSIVLTKQNGM